MGSHEGHSGSAGIQWGLWFLKVRRVWGHFESPRGSPRVLLFVTHRQQSAGGIGIGPQLHVLKQLCCPLLQGPQGGRLLAQCLLILHQAALQTWG